MKLTPQVWMIKEVKNLACWGRATGHMFLHKHTSNSKWYEIELNKNTYKKEENLIDNKLFLGTSFLAILNWRIEFDPSTATLVYPVLWSC